jgi:hypothetical protein
MLTAPPVKTGRMIPINPPSDRPLDEEVVANEVRLSVSVNSSVTMKELIHRRNNILGELKLGKLVCLLRLRDFCSWQELCRVQECPIVTLHVGTSFLFENPLQVCLRSNGV